MFDNIVNFFKKMVKEKKTDSKDTAKERLHLVLMQDRANVSVDFLELMKQEIIDVIKKYIDVDENSIDVKLTNKSNSDGTTGAPILYANIPIVSIKEENKNKVKEKVEETPKESMQEEKVENKQEEVVEEVLEESKEEIKEEIKEDKKEEEKKQEETAVEDVKEDVIENVENKKEIEEEKPKTKKQESKKQKVKAIK